MSDATTAVEGREAARAQATRSDLHALARDGVIALGGTFAAGVLGFVLVIIVTRGVGSHGAGIFFEAVALFMILSSVSVLGADTGLVRSISRFRALGREQDLRPTLLVGLGPVFLVSILFSVIVFALAPQLAGIFMRGAGLEEGTKAIRLLAPFLPLSSGAIAVLAGARGFGKILPYIGLEKVGKALLRPVCAIAVLAMGLGTVAVTVSWAVPLVVIFPIAIVLLLRYVRASEREAAGRGHQGERTPLGPLAREFWSFAFPRGIGFLFQLSLVWVDILLVGALRSPAEAGIYAAASRFALMGLLAMDAIRLVLAPQISALLAVGDRERAGHLYKVATWWQIASTWPVYLTLAVFAPLLMRMFGPEFAKGEAALVILSLSFLAAPGSGNVNVILLMAGKSRWNLANTFVSLTINIVLNLVLIPRLGITGAALAWAASMLFDSIAPLVQVRLLLGLHPFGSGYLRVTLASVACFGLLGIGARLLLGSSLVALVTLLVVGLAVYARLLWRSRHMLELPLVWEAIKSRAPGRTDLPEREGVA